MSAEVDAAVAAATRLQATFSDFTSRMQVHLAQYNPAVAAVDTPRILAMTAQISNLESQMVALLKAFDDKLGQTPPAGLPPITSNSGQPITSNAGQPVTGDTTVR